MLGLGGGLARGLISSNPHPLKNAFCFCKAGRPLEVCKADNFLPAPLPDVLISVNSYTLLLVNQAKTPKTTHFLRLATTAYDKLPEEPKHFKVLLGSFLFEFHLRVLSTPNFTHS